PAAVSGLPPDGDGDADADLGRLPRLGHGWRLRLAVHGRRPRLAVHGHRPRPAARAAEGHRGERKEGHPAWQVIDPHSATVSEEADRGQDRTLAASRPRSFSQSHTREATLAVQTKRLLLTYLIVAVRQLRAGISYLVSLTFPGGRT